jgi:hypothetical protein
MSPKAFQSSRSSLQGSGESKKHCSEYGPVKKLAFSKIICITFPQLCFQAGKQMKYKWTSMNMIHYIKN